jgi:hypothetical protein
MPPKKVTSPVKDWTQHFIEIEDVVDDLNIKPIHPLNILVRHGHIGHRLQCFESDYREHEGSLAGGRCL